MPQEPLPEWTPPPCERDPETMPPADADAFARINWGMTAHWRGKVTTSFGSGDPSMNYKFIVDVTFEPDGHYTSHSLMPNYTAFYYDSDEASPEKQWKLNAISVPETQGARGQITVVFGPGNTQQGQLESVLVSEDLAALRFRFLPTWIGATPILYELRCEP